MKEAIAYLNGQIVPFSSVRLSPLDSGFVLGVSVAEQLRTFRGKLFCLEDHLARLAASLEITGVDIDESNRRLADIGRELVEHNHSRLERGDDLGLGIFVTPGEYRGYGTSGEKGPTVCLHTYPLPFALWHEKYETGQKLAIPPTRHVPADCWPSALKCRSRMHYYLADRQAAAMHPGARALLLDSNGHVTEASTANLLVYRSAEGIVSPSREKVLPGISLAKTVELSDNMGLKAAERDLTPEEVRSADEVFLTSTPLCILPVVELDGHRIGEGRPGDLFHRLIRDWNDAVGLDIIAQARRFANRTYQGGWSQPVESL